MKLDELNGTYSAVGSSIAGSSIATLSIQDGVFSGWDISGTRYSGTVTTDDDGSITFDVDAKMPPNSFAIWGTSLSETFQTRHFSHTVPPGEFVEGRKITLPREGLDIVFRRIPDEFAVLAGPDGLAVLIDTLVRAHTAWQQSGK